jgi:uncharacterized protein YyaL (SSP411 family)
MKLKLIGFIALLCVACNAAANVEAKSLIAWKPHDIATFTQASKEKKFLLLDLVAVWCHWCHVMDAKTYADEKVAAYIKQHFIPVKADHDARPDLAERYRDWGWPATIVYAPDGTELVKRAGYIDPESMLQMLTAIVNDPTAESQQAALPQQFSDAFKLGAEVKKELIARNVASHDNKQGGLLIDQRYVDLDTIEWDLHLAAQGDKAAEKRVRRTLDAARALIDPEFGGVYQYSTDADWRHPHFEKVMRSQWANLRAYALAAIQFKDKRYGADAEKIGQYLLDFLRSKEGAFYNSQDADLSQAVKGQAYFALRRAARLKKGQPRIDKHLYASSNGQAIEALLLLYQASGKAVYYNGALEAAAWTLKNRRYADGGFRHNQVDDAGPYLSDTLFMGRALLQLYKISGDQQALALAAKAGSFINQWFRYPQAGLVSAVDNGTPAKPIPQMDQNIVAARFALALYRQTHDPVHADLAKHILRYLTTQQIALQRLTEAGVLLADVEREQVLAEQVAKR